MKGQNRATKVNTKQNKQLKITVIYNYWNVRDCPLSLETIGRKGAMLLVLLSMSYEIPMLD